MKNRYVIINKIFNASQRRGFTLVEVLVAVALVVILSGVVLAILLAGSEFWQTDNVRIQLQQELRKAKSTMADELRQSGLDGMVNVLPNGLPYDDITFKKAIGVSGGAVDWSADIQFLRSGPELNELHRVTGLSDKLVAQHIVSMQVVRPDTDTDRILEVTLTAQMDTVQGRTITRDLNFKIYLRN